MYCYIRTTYRVHYCTPLSPVYCVPYRPKGKPRQSSARCISSHIIHGDSLVHGRRVHTYTLYSFQRQSARQMQNLCAIQEPEQVRQHNPMAGMLSRQPRRIGTSRDCQPPYGNYLVCNTPYSRVLYSIRSNLYGNIRSKRVCHSPPCDIPNRSMARVIDIIQADPDVALEYSILF